MRHSKLLSALQSRRDELLVLAARRGASNLRVFGSAARGDDKAGSDVDLLVSMAPGSSLVDLAALRDDLESALGRPVDVVTEPGLYPYLRERILRDAIPL